MAHYAFLDEDNIVTEVIVGIDENEVVDGIDNWEAYYASLRGQRCVRTSYNNNIRKQFAGIGYRYDEVADVFICPSMYPSWTLDENYDWQPPTPMPSEGIWIWNEESLSWIQR